MAYEKIATFVEQFCAGLDENDKEPRTIDTGIGIGEIRYVRNEDAKFKKVLSDLFGVEDAYKTFDSNFVLFSLDGHYIAAGTYSVDRGAAWLEGETEDIRDIILEELVAAKKIADLVADNKSNKGN